LIVLAQIAAAHRKAEQQRIYQKLQSDLQAFKEDVAHLDGKAEVVEDFGKSVKKDLNALAASGTKAQKSFFTFVIEFMNELTQVQDAWLAAFEAVPTAEMLDYGGLNGAAEYDRRRALLKGYLAETEKMQQYVTQLPQHLEEKFRDVDADSGLKKGFLDRAKEKGHKLVPAGFTQAHLERGKTMIAFLDVLQANPQAWRVEDETLVIDPGPVFREATTYFEKITALDESIDRFAQ
jgi:hypothetical protein